VTAYVFRFVDKTRSQPEERHCGPIYAAEFKEVKLKWVKDVQQDVSKDALNRIR